MYWHSQTTVCLQDFSYAFTYCILNLKCSRTPYYSLQYLFIHEWEITNSFPYLSVLIFSTVFNGSKNFVMGVYTTIY